MNTAIVFLAGVAVGAIALFLLQQLGNLLGKADELPDSEPPTNKPEVPVPESKTFAIPNGRCTEMGTDRFVYFYDGDFYAHHHRFTENVALAIVNSIGSDRYGLQLFDSDFEYIHKDGWVGSSDVSIGSTPTYGIDIPSEVKMAYLKFLKEDK